MTTILLLIIGFFASIFGAFGEITSQNASSTGYTPIPEAVRAYYSKEVLFQAQPRCKFLQFAKQKRDLQAARGKSITFVRYNNLTGGGELDEDETLTAVAMAASEIVITVKEQGNAVEISELLLKTSLLDILGDATKQLANNVADVLDKQLRDAALSTTNVIYGNGAANSTAMNTNSVMNARTIKDAVELLSMNNAPKINVNGDQFYVCFANPKQYRQIMDDPEWINSNTYNGRRQLYAGEVGMFHGVVFIDTTQMPYLTSAQVVSKYGGSFTPTYACEAVMFGENPYAWGVVIDPELRDDGVKEFGRKHAIAWYGIWGTGILEEANVVRILTAAT